MDAGAAGAKIERGGAPGIGAHHRTSISRDAAVFARGFHVSRELRRSLKSDAAIGGLNIHSFAIPAVSSHRDVNSAVGRLALHVSTDLLQVNSAVDRVEHHLAVYIGNVDAAIVGGHH